MFSRTILVTIENVLGISSSQKGNAVKRGAIGFVLSLIAPGVGQLFNGQLAKGLLVWLAFPILLLICWAIPLLEHFWGLVILFGLRTCWNLLAAIEAARTSVRQARDNAVVRRTWIVYALMLVLVAPDIALRPVAILDRIGVRAYEIPAESMAPTIDVGDRLIASNKYYKNRPPERGDIIVFRSPTGLLLVKRVIAMGGDTIEGRENETILVNGKILNEPYLKPIENPSPNEGKADLFGPRLIPVGKYFVMGDNRHYSLDSRFEPDGNPPGPGLVDGSQIVGRPLYFYWSRQRSKIGQSIR